MCVCSPVLWSGVCVYVNVWCVYASYRISGTWFILLNILLKIKSLYFEREIHIN